MVVGTTSVRQTDEKVTFDISVTIKLPKIEGRIFCYIGPMNDSKNFAACKPIADIGIFTVEDDVHNWLHVIRT